MPRQDLQELHQRRVGRGHQDTPDDGGRPSLGGCNPSLVTRPGGKEGSKQPQSESEHSEQSRRMPEVPGQPQNQPDVGDATASASGGKDRAMSRDSPRGSAAVAELPNLQQAELEPAAKSFQGEVERLSPCLLLVDRRL